MAQFFAWKFVRRVARMGPLGFRSSRAGGTSLSVAKGVVWQDEAFRLFVHAGGRALVTAHAHRYALGRATRPEGTRASTPNSTPIATLWDVPPDPRDETVT